MKSKSAAKGFNHSTINLLHESTEWSGERRGRKKKNTHTNTTTHTVGAFVSYLTADVRTVGALAVCGKHTNFPAVKFGQITQSEGLLSF